MICPFCRDDIFESEITCGVCNAGHHKECWDENFQRCASCKSKRQGARVALRNFRLVNIQLTDELKAAFYDLPRASAIFLFFIFLETVMLFSELFIASIKLFIIITIFLGKQLLVYNPLLTYIQFLLRK